MRTKRKVNPKIHPIDKRSTYDVAHVLRAVADGIDNGFWGKVDDAVIIVHSWKDGKEFCQNKVAGSGHPDKYIGMLNRTLKQIV